MCKENISKKFTGKNYENTKKYIFLFLEGKFVSSENATFLFLNKWLEIGGDDATNSILKRNICQRLNNMKHYITTLLPLQFKIEFELSTKI